MNPTEMAFSSTGGDGDSDSVQPASAPIRVLFVCLGNICRSPMAHAVFENIVSAYSFSASSTFPSPPSSSAATPPSADVSSSAGHHQHPCFVVDSAGTGAYHAGDPPDPRTLRTLEQHGIAGFAHPARKVRPSDFADFDYVLAMDEDNLEDLQVVRAQMAHDNKERKKLAKLSMFGAYAPGVAAAKGVKAAERRDDDDGRGEGIVDPYYGGNRGFDLAFEQCERFSKGFLAEVLGKDWEEKAERAKKL